jgi:hypothetical protein
MFPVQNGLEISWRGRSWEQNLKPEASNGLFFLRRQRQTEHGNPAFPGNVYFRVLRTGQIQCLAMFATVDFGVLTPGFFRVATGLLNHIRSVEPAFQMSAAELAFLVLLVAGTLSRLLNLDLVMRKLRRSLRVRSGHFARRQRTYPRSRGASAARVAVRAQLYLKISISLRGAKLGEAMNSSPQNFSVAARELGGVRSAGSDLEEPSVSCNSLRPG